MDKQTCTEKVILITGASKGIGAELLRGFAQQGHSVVLNYAHSDQAATKVYQAALAVTPPEKLLMVKADVAVRDEVCRMYDCIYDVFGKLDVLINNAGQNIDGPFLEMNDTDWNRVINTILTGSFICSQEFARRYAGNDGHILNIGATTGLKGRKNGVNYCSAKAGILTMTKCLALELAPRIKVNCIIPGFINTEEVITRYQLDDPEKREALLKTIPLGRLGTPEDIFNMADFLIQQSSFITGQNFFITGGHFMG